MNRTSYFVYYKIDPAKRGELGSLVDALFRSVERASGIRGRWMRRRDDPTTYMEVYEGVNELASFESLLEREAARLGIARCLGSGAMRRTETFVVADPGAGACA